jgi:hypothetical protein
MVMEGARRCLFAKSFRLIIVDDKSLSIQEVVINKLDKVNWRVSHVPRESPDHQSAMRLRKDTSPIARLPVHAAQGLTKAYVGPVKQL